MDSRRFIQFDGMTSRDRKSSTMEVVFWAIGRFPINLWNGTLRNPFFQSWKVTFQSGGGLLDSYTS